MSKPVAPCPACKYVGCGAYHDECDKYQQYLKDLEIFNAGIKEERKKQTDFMSYITRTLGRRRQK